MIKAEKVGDIDAVHEFDMEHGLLARLDHPRIVKILGAGDIPRKFLVLEYLEGGTLQDKFDRTKKANKKSILRPFRPKVATFTFPEVLQRARELAGVMKFLHEEVHADACFIHRDLKPDNIAFLGDGRLILFDFGLMTVVQRRTDPEETYDMTGGTGSLRYMAPEVVLNKPYNEKVDVYSFAVIVWQMGTDETPYLGCTKAEYLAWVCKEGERPEFKKSWPPEFNELLSICWHHDFVERPTFSYIMEELDKLMLKFPVTQDQQTEQQKTEKRTCCF